MTISPFLSIAGIRKRFGSRLALDTISLDVAQSEFLTLLGPSGSGKSTLLGILAGFVAPDQGLMRLRGQDITHASPEMRRFGVVPQGYGLFPHMTVQENVAFPLRVRGRERSRINARVKEVLELLQIDDLRSRLPKALSGGQQQRVALARALSFEPDILLLDEPMSALDALLRRDLQAELTRLHRQVGTTFIYVTHDQQEALALSDRVVVLNEGRIEQIGTPRSIYDQPASRFVANFLGKNNLLPVAAARRADGRLHFSWNGYQISADTAALKAASFAGSCVLAIRPENIAIARIGVASPPPHDQIRGTVVSQVFHGASADIIVAVGSESLTVTSPVVAALPAPGEEVWLAFDPERMWRLPEPSAGLPDTTIAAPELAA